MPTVDPSNPSRFLFSTGTRQEFQFGYSRAVRHGQLVRVAGTAGTDPDGNVLSEDIESVAVVHGETFREIRPATTIVKVDFIDPKILVEIEAEAVYGGADEKR